MSDYIPTTDDVEGFYNQGVSEFGPVTSDPDYHDFDGKFRLWLAEHDRQTAAAAWDEAVDWLSRHWLDRVPKAVDDMEAANPYKETQPAAPQATLDRCAALRGHIDTLLQESGGKP